MLIFRYRSLKFCDDIKKQGIRLKTKCMWNKLNNILEKEKEPNTPKKKKMLDDFEDDDEDGLEKDEFEQYLCMKKPNFDSIILLIF